DSGEVTAVVTGNQSLGSGADSGRHSGATRPDISVVHVGNNEPTPLVILAQSQRELSNVGLPFLARKPADDGADGPFSRLGEGSQNERTARTVIVLPDRVAAANRRRAAWQDEAVFRKQIRERRAITLAPRRLVVRQDTG